MRVQRGEKVKCPRISLGMEGQGAEKVKCPRISLDMGSLNPNEIRGHLTFSAKKLNAHAISLGMGGPGGRKKLNAHESH